MKIEIISCLNDNYSYLIHDEISNTVAIVDPSEFMPCDTIISKNYQKLDFAPFLTAPCLPDRHSLRDCSRVLSGVGVDTED